MKTDQSAPISDEHRDGLEHRLARVERGEEAFID
jgi:3-phenylpropionate/cinnamic acid dioxygenase small subunit